MALFTKENKHFHIFMGVFVVLVICAGMVAKQLLFPVHTSQEVFPTEETKVVGTEVAQVSTNVLPKSLPLQLRIPSINVQTSFEGSLGVTDDLEVEVPQDYDSVGLYKFGPTPGELGPSIVLGHVDSKEGPAVFYTLGQVEIGDEVFVDREDGTTAVFVVTHYERPAQDFFPTEQVYGNIAHAGLRLITCTGNFDKGEERYTHNLIVYAALQRVEEAN